MIADYHLHSYYSEDSDVLMEDMVRHGISLGIDELVFTEHVDYGGKPGYYIDYEKYFHEIDALNQKYPAISIKKGVEFGVQQHLVERYERDYEQIKDEIDYIILSVHDIENQNLYDGIYHRMSDSMPSRALLKKFYDMGGRIVTIGSDAHDLVHMGDHVEETKMMLKEIGFTEFCTFEKQKPVFWPL